MAIVNMLPGGGENSVDIPSYSFPATISFRTAATSASLNSSLKYFFVNSNGNGSNYRLIASTYSTSSGGNGIKFYPLKNFTAKYRNSNNSTVTYTFEKGKTYEITYYYVSSKYYFKISEDGTVKVSENSSTNRWSTYLLDDIQQVT